MGTLPSFTSAVLRILKIQIKNTEFPPEIFIKNIIYFDTVIVVWIKKMYHAAP